MKSWAFAGLLLAAAIPAVPAAAQDWNAEYEVTDLGHRIGNPEAPLQLIEFVSYTCPHCAHFEHEAEAELRYYYIHEGHAALEVRPFIRNIVDIAATLVAECGADDKFFDNHRTLLLTQDDWLGVARELTPAQQQRWNSGPIASRMRAIADDLGFYELMEPKGYTISQLDACLSDEAQAQAIAANPTAGGAEMGVQGTPSFALNGALLDGVHSWPQLSQVLTTARETPAAVTE